MGHKGPVLRPRFIGSGRARTQIPYQTPYSFHFLPYTNYTSSWKRKCVLHFVNWHLTQGFRLLGFYASTRLLRHIMAGVDVSLISACSMRHQLLVLVLEVCFKTNLLSAELCNLHDNSAAFCLSTSNSCILIVQPTGRTCFSNYLFL